MRALRVIGLDTDGTNVVCEDSEHKEKFLVPADDKLRAAARGDLARLGQIEIALESHLRPRDIQSRIRAGASVEQVATAAGVSVSRVERFAHPVLLERSRAAEVAQESHPLRPDGPAVPTLTEIVHDAFAERGQDLTEAAWDAWRGGDSRWVVQLRWTTGHSDNKAHWCFHPGAHGGTVAALDDPAADLIDPNPTRPLRTVAAVTTVVEPEAEATLAVEEPVPAPEVLLPAALADGGPRAALDAAPADEPTETAEQPATRSDEQAVTRSHEQPEQQAAKSAATKPSAKSAQRARRGHAPVPSWEDVLLGVRSQRG